MKIFLLSMGMAFLNLFIQIRPRLYNRQFGIDGWRHLLIANYIRKYKRYPGNILEKFLINAPTDYPPGLRLFLSLFPKRFIDKYEWLVCPFFDFLHMLLVSGTVYFFTKDIRLSLTAQVIYMLSPLNVMENSNLTTRAPASFLFSLTFMAILSFSIYKIVWILALAVILVSIILLTHRMSIQALLFLCITFTIFERNISYLAILLGGMILAIIVSKGFYIKIFRGHMAMLEYWRQNIKYRYAHEIRGLPKKGERNPDMVFRLYQKVKSAPFIAIIAANPFILIPIFYIFTKNIFLKNFDYCGIPDIFLKKMLVWVITLFIVGIIIRQIKKVEFMGEGERYLEYANFPNAIVCSIVLKNALAGQYSFIFFSIFAAIAIGCALIPALYIQDKVIKNDKDRSVTPSLRKIFDFINSITGNVKMMCIPLGLTASTMYFTKAGVLSTDNSIAHITDLADILPVVRKPFVEIFRKYGINYLLVNENYVTLGELVLPKNEVVIKEGQFTLLKVRE